MRIDIVEQRTLGKREDARLNEDGIYANDCGNGFIAVVDGVTSKSTANIWDPTPGVVAKDTILAALRRAHPEIDLRGMQRLIDDALREKYRSMDMAVVDINAGGNKDEDSGKTYTRVEGNTNANRNENGAHADRNTHANRNENGTHACKETRTGVDTTNTVEEKVSAGSIHGISGIPYAGETLLDHVRNHPNDRLQANAVIYSAARHEIWLFGDCQAMVNGHAIPTIKRVDVLLGELRSFAWHALLLQGPQDQQSLSDDWQDSCDSHDQARDMIMPFLRLQSQFANRRGEYGYFVFDGFTDPEYPVRVINAARGESEPPTRSLDWTLKESPRSPAGSTEQATRAKADSSASLLQSSESSPQPSQSSIWLSAQSSTSGAIGVVSVRPGDDVVLASDGYPILRPTLAESERELERLRHEDPHLVNEFRTSKGFTPELRSFDDRTYIRFTPRI